MATFMNKALAYLGLKDIEDDEYYDDEYDEVEEPAARGGRTVYPEREYVEAPEPRTFGGTVRPISPIDAPGPAPRPSLVRPMMPNRTAKVSVVAPERFNEAQAIGDLVKQSHPVIVNLQLSDLDLSRRMIDFCAGLTYALGGAMDKVADQVFLLTPSNVEVSEEDRRALEERGLFNQP
ncbi:MAG TPA: cell division protein SepF [Acidimicrobiales bacterium]|nr:cell division protein SepF [Acidimicrobiales bacterium]